MAWTEAARKKSAEQRRGKAKGLRTAYHGGGPFLGKQVHAHGRTSEQGKSDIYATPTLSKLALHYGKNYRRARTAILNVTHRTTGNAVKKAGGWPGQLQHGKTFGEPSVALRRSASIIGFVPTTRARFSIAAAKKRSRKNG